MKLLLLVVVAAVLFGGFASLVVRLVHARVRRVLARLPSSIRVCAILGMLSAPLIVGISLSALALLPGLVAIVSPELDHCAHHDDGHVHLCAVHVPNTFDAAVACVVLAVVLGPVCIGIARVLVRVRRARRLVAALRRSALSARDPGVRVLHDDAPLALTAGLRKPAVYVTTGLQRAVDPTTLKAVLAHEAAHVRRRDPLVKLLGELAGALHFPAARRELLSDLSLACEQACDEEAARAIGDRTIVAAALVRLARLLEGAPTPALAGITRFGESDIVARVCTLLAPAPVEFTPRLRTTAMVLSFLALVVASPLHHATETLLGVLFG